MVIVVSAGRSLESDLGHNPAGIGKTKCVFSVGSFNYFENIVCVSAFVYIS